MILSNKKTTELANQANSVVFYVSLVVLFCRLGSGVVGVAHFA